MQDGKPVKDGNYVFDDFASGQFDGVKEEQRKGPRFQAIFHYDDDAAAPQASHQTGFNARGNKIDEEY